MPAASTGAPITMHLRQFICAATFLITACGGADRGPRDGADVGTLIPPSAQDVVIDSPVEDNASGAPSTAIAATVYLPERTVGETVPLILHSHGWGGDRVTQADTQGEFDTSNFYSVAIDSQVGRFWQEGYAVISFDERGFHESGGAIRVMDPAYETRDAIAVLDWAEANLPLARSSDGNPLVGAIGGSYGGGFQLLLAAFDDRLDAITPSTTWYDLPDSLAPHGVIKKLWDFGLCFSALSAGDRRFSDELTLACQQAGFDPSIRFSDELDPAVLDFLGAHGMGAIEARHKDPADPFVMRPIDTLLTQGQRDLLFPLNDALDNARFLASLGGDVRLITHQHGHYIGPPLDAQAPLGAMRCGSLDTLNAKHAWFAEKLKGQVGAAAAIPAVCIGLDDERGIELPSVPRADGSVRLELATTTVSADQNNYGGNSPTFVSMANPVSADKQVLAGLPVANLNITALLPGTDVVAFVGIGVQSPGDNAARLIDDQITALRAGEHVDLELTGVGEALQAGDQIGVLLFGDHDAFNTAAHSSWLANNYQISGSIDLPVVVAP